MYKEAVKNKIPEQTVKAGDPLNNAGVLEIAQLLWDELRGLSVDRLQLAALEMQRAVDGLVSMVISGVMIAVLLLSAWLGALAAVVLVLIENGVTVSSAILLAVAANLFLTLILFAAIRRKRRFFQFSSTLRSLQPITPERLDAEKSS
ncbi:phage holin family protein [Methylicorpusculum sp.]|uniref:phage holin family protein n=1 Tax=Methylicorpusculum sp. TaxID=2713644 RepID=UPI00272F9834|nr:phage holin family protein [Methylicorpusculum sp.]MDP2180785.1 phage holin family protein [Methylicorpusculum sp.]MDP3527896.1 phage holin family protein [Methylicorpusculum sp.]MDZ4154637.1 phage holin family protein [Methylicorpusculum sp.]